jgi:hypothetical protein
MQLFFFLDFEAVEPLDVVNEYWHDRGRFLLVPLGYYLSVDPGSASTLPCEFYLAKVSLRLLTASQLCCKLCPSLCLCLSVRVAADRGLRSDTIFGTSRKSDRMD